MSKELPLQRDIRNYWMSHSSSGLSHIIRSYRYHYKGLARHLIASVPCAMVTFSVHEVVIAWLTL